PDGRTIALNLAGLVEADAVISGNLSALTAPDTGTLPTANVSGSTFSAELRVSATNNAGNPEPIDLYFTETAANTWQVAAFSATSGHSAGSFPYSSGALLGSETLIFNGAGTVASGGVFFVSGTSGGDVSLDLTGLTESTAATALSTNPVS